MNYKANWMNSRGWKVLGLCVFFLWGNKPLWAQVKIESELTVDEVVQTLVGEGIRVKNSRFTGNPEAVARFSEMEGLDGLTRGIVLSTGKAADMAGPNDRSQTGTYNERGGDKDLTYVAGIRTFDAVTLDFDFMANKDSFSLNFVYASEAYNEQVGSTFNDPIIIEISGPGMRNGKNLALIPGTNIPINLNHISSNKNRRYYRDNNPFFLNGKPNPERKAELDPVLLENLQYDGLTTLFSVGTKVKPRTSYHLRITIADAGGNMYDSGLLLEGGSLSSMEQLWRQRRREAIEAQRIADSTHVADSIALVRANFVADSLAEVAAARRLDSLAQVAEAFRLDSIAKANAALQEDFGISQDGRDESVIEEKNSDPWAEEEEEAPKEPIKKDIRLTEPGLREDREPSPRIVLNDIPTGEVSECRFVFEFTAEEYFLSEEEDQMVSEMGTWLKEHTDKKVGIHTPDGSQNADLRYDIVRMDLVKAGVSSDRIFRNGFSFLGGRTGHGRERVEILIK